MSTKKGQNPTPNKPIKIGVAEGFAPPLTSSKRSGHASENGLFGRCSARPNPYNPGCSRGAKSITVVSAQRQNKISSTKITAYDGFEASPSDKSKSHLTSRHGHYFGVNDPLPPSTTKRPTKYPQIRTRINKENKEAFTQEVGKILTSPTTEVYTDVKIRRIGGRVYHCPQTDRIIGIHTEGEFSHQILKAQPTSDAQLGILRESHIID